MRLLRVYAKRLDAVLDAPDILTLMEITAPLWGPDASAENHFGLLPLE